MSLSASLSNALTGLAASTRAAELVSNNVANAMTEGYARRELLLSSRVVGGTGAGVQIDGVQRVVDEGLLRDRRLSQASLAEANVQSDYHRDLMSLVGLPDEASSLSAQLVGFENALAEAAARPDSEARLATVLSAANQVTHKLSEVSEEIQQLREDADRQIANSVERLNGALVQIDELNDDILRARATGRDYNGLLDQRQKLIDEISEIIPIKQIPRENETVALYTVNGGPLFETEPAVIEFTPTEPITAELTLAGGSLSGLSINGYPITTSGSNAAIAGGELAGLFHIRDALAPAAQADLDEVARDLVDRFQDPAVDPSLLIDPPPVDPLAATQIAGLFTGTGNVFDPANLTGLAGRIHVNTSVDPSQGGALWRLRDGLGATAPGAPGDPTLLNAMSEALSNRRVPTSGSLGANAKDASGFVSAMLSNIGHAVNTSGNRQAYEQARFDSLKQAELANGVDTDQEMQKLLQIEQAYAANAKVIQAVDDMMQILIGL